MSIFGKITEAIFGSPAHAEGAPPAPAATPAAGDVKVAANSPTAAPAAGSAAAAKTPVDVVAILDAIDDKTDEKLDWTTSIVDLLKLLKIDSSLTARKQLAHELGFTGDTSDSAKMNVWLHKAVMQKIADNGGVVPKELLG